MVDFFHLFISPPNSSLLYAGHYDPVLVSLSVAAAIFSSYAALLVSQHVASSTVASARRMWIAAGGLCLGMGIWAMHFVGMLAFSLPCTTGYDASITLLSMIPGVLACTLALTVISRRTLSRGQLVTGGLLLGSGIGAMHYAGMAALRLEGLLRYDLTLFVLSILAAVVLATLAIWIKFRLQARVSRWSNWLPLVSASTMGLAVSAMHYTGMSAAYFVQEGDSGIVDSPLGAPFLAAIVLAVTGLIIVVTLVATYVVRPNLLSLRNSYKVIGLLIIGWSVASWLSADYYHDHHVRDLHQQELQLTRQHAQAIATHIDESLQLLKAIPLMLSLDENVHQSVRRFGAHARLNHALLTMAAQLQADAILVLNAAGDTVAASDFDKPGSAVGSNNSARAYFLQARDGKPGHQYVQGLTTGQAGLYYSQPIMENGQFLGAVVVMRHISGFSRWMSRGTEFITDTRGVMVLAPDRPLAMRVPPDANGGQPAVLVAESVADGMLTVRVPGQMDGLARIHIESVGLFILITAAGSMLILAVSAVVLYLRETRKVEADLRIAATAFESQEAMMITDANNVILRVNHAFSRITGYSADEVVGKNPSLLKSGRHQTSFYAAMWDTLRRTGAWQGEVWDRRKNGEVYPKWLTITVVKGPDGQVTNYVGMHTDITQDKAAENEIQHLAFYDQLTQLPNRRLLLDRLQQALVACVRSGCVGALLFIDLDNFKTINDTMGHDKGDLLLAQVAMRLADSVREGDTVARLGGDEFVVMLEAMSDVKEEAATQAEMVGAKILSALGAPYDFAGHPYHGTTSIGITLFADYRDTVDDLLKRADLAMYQAKAAGRNTQRFFDPAMQAVVSARAALESDLRQGLQLLQFVLHYQPQVDRDGGVVGAEALLRWCHPERGMVSPMEFIPLAEDTGMILPLGLWVLQSACAQLVAWANHAHTTDLVLAVNVSARQFRQVDFVAEVLGVLAYSGARGDRLKLELTESVVVDDVGDIIEKMLSLKAHGVRFSMDDFGTGYSSLSYLRRLPLDQLKIDQSFVSEVLTDANDAAIAKTIITLGQSLGLNVIAEGVETEDQRNFLALAGCLHYQGYLFSKPLSVGDFEKFAASSLSF